MKITEKVQRALSGARLMHSRNGAIRGRLVNCAVLLLMMLIMIPVAGCVPEERQVYGEPDEHKEPFIPILVPPIRGLVLEVEGEGEDGYTITAGRAVLMIRCFENPITLDEINKVQENVHYKAEKDLGEAPEPPYLTRESELKSEPPARIVAFGFTIDDDWVPIGYIGEAVNEGAVEAIHRRAKVWFKDLLWQKQEQAATETHTRGWPLLLKRSRELGWAPYGVLMSRLIVYQMPADRCTRYDFFAIRQDFLMTPGKEEWDSGWINTSGSLKHLWGIPESKALHLVNYTPIGRLIGSQSFTVGLGSLPAPTWTYRQPNVITYDYSILHWRYMHRIIRFHCRHARRTTGEMNPGSFATTPQYRDGHLRLLAQVQAVGTFSESGTEHHIGFDTYIWVRARDI